MTQITDISDLVSEKVSTAQLCNLCHPVCVYIYTGWNKTYVYERAKWQAILTFNSVLFSQVPLSSSPI